MGPLEALHRFQIDCGDLDSPAPLPKLPPVEPLAKPIAVAFPLTPPPDLPLPVPTEVAENVPPLADVPTAVTPIEAVPSPSPVPEPQTILLVLSGALLLVAKRSLGTSKRFEH